MPDPTLPDIRIAVELAIIDALAGAYDVDSIDITVEAPMESPLVTICATLARIDGGRQ